jgi:UPF0716 family protein affecting phage T7 exclusion
MAQAFSQVRHAGDAPALAKQVFASLSRFAAALLLIFPGYLTDAFALLLLLIAPKPLLVDPNAPFAKPRGASGNPHVYEGEAREVHEAPPKLPNMDSR